MNVNTNNDENGIVYALALAWATMDGKRDRFLDDKAGKLGPLDGTYDGYMIEAAYVVDQLRADGWRIEKSENNA